MHTTNSRVPAFAIEQASRLTRDRLLAYRDEERAPKHVRSCFVRCLLAVIRYVAVRHFDTSLHVVQYSRNITVDRTVGVHKQVANPFLFSTTIVAPKPLGLKANALLHGKDRVARMVNGHDSDDALRIF